jgi:Flp pilus assembly pilin Flp
MREQVDTTMLEMYAAVRTWLARLDRTDEEGALSAEYVGILVVVGLVIAALWGLNVPQAIAARGSEAVSNLFGGG